MKELPIFPLSTVLFPGMSLPIHVFQERYRIMIRDCLLEKRPFGVVLIQQGSETGTVSRFFEVGVSASIDRVEKLPEDRMNVIVTGQERFRIDDVIERRPYLVARVDVLKSYGSEKPAAQELAESVTALFGDYYRLHLALSNQWSRRIGVPGKPSELADFVASHLSVDGRLKQHLLETLSVVRRLEMEQQILSEKIREFTSRLKSTQRQRFAGLSAIN